jgi:MATE family multidrug resistance protein
VVANLASVVYMLPLSIAVATGAHVAQLRGAGHHAEAAAAGWQGIAMSVGLSTTLAAGLYTVRDTIVSAYTPDPQVQAVALRLFIFIVLYQVFDAAQVTIAFALRSYRIAMLPAVAYVLSLWGLGLAGGYVIGFDLTGHTPEQLRGAGGFWAANAAALSVVSLALMALYRHASRKAPTRD